MKTWRATAHFALLGFMSFAALSCRDKKNDKTAHQFEKQKIVRSSNDVSLPTKLWDLVAQGIGNEQTEFVPVSVTLIEKTSGVLGGHNHEITFGPGGGELDLKDYVIGPGSFWFSAALIEKPVETDGKKLPGETSNGTRTEKKEEKPAEPKPADRVSSGPSFKVFYLPQAKERTLDGLKYGSGCHSYSDITSYFTKSAANEGMLGLVAKQRYVSTLSGVYFLSLRDGDRLQLAQITVHDSRYPELLCPRDAVEPTHE